MLSDPTIPKEDLSINHFSTLKLWEILFPLAEVAKKLGFYSLFWELRRQGLREQARGYQQQEAGR